MPVIDFSTTNPLGSVETGGLSYEELATGHDLGEGRSAVYQRLWQPGVARFEESLAGLEGTEGAVAFASGMAALAADAHRHGVGRQAARRRRAPALRRHRPRARERPARHAR